MKKERITIGSIIEGYRVEKMCNLFVYAERINPINCDDYVVWNIDYNGCGVNTGRYYSNRIRAIENYISLKEIAKKRIHEPWNAVKNNEKELMK